MESIVRDRGGGESRYGGSSGNCGEVIFKKNRGVYCLELQRGQVVIRINNKRRL